MTGVTAFQVCDCDVPVGSHEYQVTPPEGGYEGSTPYRIKIVITNPPPQPQQPPQPPEGEIDPWDEPDPAWPQGLDCVAACQATVPEPDADVPTIPDTPADVPVAADVAAETGTPADVPGSDATAPADTTTSAQPDTGLVDGCIAGPLPAPGAGLPFAAALLLAALSRIRRRNHR